MDKIKRTINLEEFKNRFYTGSTEFGKTLSKNIFIPQSETLIREVRKKIPLIGRSILRYGTMLYILRNLNEILNNMFVYQVCRRNGMEVKLVRILDNDLQDDTEFIFAHSIAQPRETRVFIEESGDTYYAEEDKYEGDYLAYAIELDDDTLYYVFNNDIQITNGIDIGQYIFVAENYDFLFSKFYIEEDGVLTAPMMARAKYFYNFANEKKYEIGNRKNFIPLPIYLEQEIEDMGIFTSIAEQWVPYKKYYIGDSVEDPDGILWTLKQGTDVDLMPVHLSLKAFFDKQKESHAESYIFTTYIPSDAYTDSSKIYVLEDSNGNYKVIKAFYSGITIDENYWEKETDSSVIVYTAVTESRINKFYHPDVDDNSKEMPFKIVWDEVQTESGTTPTLKPGGEHSGEIYYETTLPFYGESLTWVTGETEEGLNEITFTYSGTNEGIFYEEAYSYQMEFGYFDFTINEHDTEPTKLFLYMSIKLDEGLSIGETKKSNITVTIERDGTESQKAPYYKEEALIGVQDLTADVANLNIERGKSAAFERHSILGEVSTFDDLEKYRNGFFAMKED